MTDGLNKTLTDYQRISKVLCNIRRLAKRHTDNNRFALAVRRELNKQEKV